MEFTSVNPPHHLLGRPRAAVAAIGSNVSCAEHSYVLVVDTVSRRSQQAIWNNTTKSASEALSISP